VGVGEGVVDCVGEGVGVSVGLAVPVLVSVAEGVEEPLGVEEADWVLVGVGVGVPTA